MALLIVSITIISSLVYLFCNNIVKTGDSDQRIFKYPQRLCYDAVNQIMYVAYTNCYELGVFDVSEQWDIKKLYSIQNDVFFGIHDVKLINNYSYDGIEYGNLVYVLGLNYFCVMRCNVSEHPQIMTSFYLGDYAWGEAGYFNFLSRTQLFSVISFITTPGKILFLDVTRPFNLVNSSMMTTMNDKPWNTCLSNDGSYMYVSGTGENRTTTIYDIKNIHDIKYAGYVDDTCLFIEKDSSDDNIIYVCSNNTLKIYDYSQYDDWIELGHIIVDSNGEFQVDKSNEIAALRHYKKDDMQDRDGIDFYDISDKTRPFYIGSYSDGNNTLDTHALLLDMENNRGFFLSYGDFSFYALNMTINDKRIECSLSDSIIDSWARR